MKKQSEDWITLADFDLKTAEIVMNDDEPLTSIAAFHSQQAIEKYFKAYLVEYDIPLVKTHDLIQLNGMIKEIKDFGIDKDILIKINEVYIESRYPGELGVLPDGIPTNEQARKFIEFAQEVKTTIMHELKT